MFTEDQWHFNASNERYHDMDCIQIRFSLYQFTYFTYNALPHNSNNLQWTLHWLVNNVIIHKYICITESSQKFGVMESRCSFTDVLHMIIELYLLTMWYTLAKLINGSQINTTTEPLPKHSKMTMAINWQSLCGDFHTLLPVHCPQNSGAISGHLWAQDGSR